MYAEVYRWFTETLGLGLMEQAAKLMNPKQASKETDAAEAIEQWEEKVNRLARHGEEYQLNEAFKNIALKKILVGKILEHYELLSFEKLPYWELFLRVKEQARNKKVEKAVAQGCTGVNAKSQRVKDQEDVPSYPLPGPKFRTPRRGQCGPQCGQGEVRRQGQR